MAKHLEKKRKDYAFWHQFNEKPNSIYLAKHLAEQCESKGKMIDELKAGQWVTFLHVPFAVDP